ncbi:MAG: ATP-binding cassette domain-containing protein [Bifidobacteriaceae bacterium]|jgi:zinc/manganese transport system ATP-binding protein|nr:ATP-binding cassette domain-containing protein [Bifidobacteriaceae bacterium]
MTSVLELKDACISRNKKIIWSNSSLSIDENTTTAIIGMNGSGKTTLLEAMLNILHLDKGNIELLGKHPKYTKHLIGYVPQKYQLAATNTIRGYDALALGLVGTKLGIRLSNKKIKKNIISLANNLQISDLLDKRLTNMSGGQLQKIAVAQAIINQPKILILDEPLANLDMQAIVDFLNLLKQLQKKSISIFIVTHDLNPIIDLIDGAIYLLDGHAHYLPVAKLKDAKLLSNLYSTKVEVIHSKTGAFIRSVE